MKIKTLSLTIILTVSIALAYSQAPTIKWQKTLGGTKDDSLVSIIPTSDGGFIVSGYSNSDISGNKTQNSIGGTVDYWIVKLSRSGAVQWDKTFGGIRIDRDPFVITTLDGGYLVGGTSDSDTSATKSEEEINDSYDFWVIKLDANGNKQWDNTIGGIQLDALVSMIQRSDGSYMLGGYSYTRGDDRAYDKSDPNRGSSLWPDYWLLKLTLNGQKIKWNKVYGGKNEDLMTSMKATRDGGYVLGGYSYSDADYEKTEPFLNNNDYWIVKVDKDGNKLWDKVYGGNLSDYLTSLAVTADGGCILGGYSNSPISFNKTEAFKGITDYWLVKIDSSRNVQWDRTLGGTLGDYLSSVQQTADGGYIVGGTSNSNSSTTKTENSKGAQDYWIMKLDAQGQELWDKTIGGSKTDKLSVITEISAGEYIIGGTSNSPISGDKTDNAIGGTGQNDYWIVRHTSRTGGAAKESAEPQSLNTITKSNNIEVRKLAMQATPNPTTGLVNVNYSATENTKLTLLVYDNSGKTIIKTTLPAGKNVYQLDLTKQARGTYYALLSSSNSSVTRIIVKQ